MNRDYVSHVTAEIFSSSASSIRNSAYYELFTSTKSPSLMAETVVLPPPSTPSNQFFSSPHRPGSFSARLSNSPHRTHPISSSRRPAVDPESPTPAPLKREPPPPLKREQHLKRDNISSANLLLSGVNNISSANFLLSSVNSIPPHLKSCFPILHRLHIHRFGSLPDIRVPLRKTSGTKLNGFYSTAKRNLVDSSKNLSLTLLLNPYVLRLRICYKYFSTDVRPISSCR